MKKMFEEDNEENQAMEKAKALTVIIPVVLIVLVLAITLVINGVKKGRDTSDDLQQSIKEYADVNIEAQTEADIEANSSTVIVGESEDLDSSNNTENDGTDSEIDDEKKDSDKEESTVSGGNLGDMASNTASPAKEDGQGNSPSPTPYQGAMKAGKKDYSKVQFQKEAQLKEMMAYWADNNQKAINDLVYLDHYIAMSFSLKGTNNFYYYGDTNGGGQPNGKGIAVYADNQYYYGDWVNGVRSGNGTWIHYHIHLVENTNDLYTYHHYTGGWANDFPEGEGSEHYDYDMSLVKGNDGYVTNRIGGYSAGLVNGDFYLITIYADESSKEWDAKADHGSWIYQNENKDRKGNRTIYVERENPDNYVWMNPKNNVNIGVPCLITQKTKN